MTDPASADIEKLRSRLFGMAYRMLGVRHDAEDAVQEALLRWQRADAASVRSAEAWLVTTLSRICVDRLRVLAAQREIYVGPWLPEPIVSEDRPPDHALELASDLSMALLVVLERLSPEERAAFLMYDAFDCGYPEIAAALGKSEAACRQLVHRARQHVRSDKRRFDVPEAAHQALVRRYAQAVRERDADTIASLLAPDAVFVSDGGGTVWAARKPVIGARRIARLETGVARKLPGRLSLDIANINGRAGLLGLLDGRVYAATSFDTDGQHIVSVLRILNPDKLGLMPRLARPG